MLRTAVKQILFNQPVKPIVSINGTQGLALDAAGGTLTNGRTSTATVIDFEGLVKTCKANEIRYAGARRVENLITQSEDFAHASWTKPASGTGATALITPNYATAPDGAQTACRVQLDKGAGTTLGDYSGFQIATTVGSSQTARLSIYIKTNDGSTKSIVFKSTANPVITVSGTWQRLSVLETNGGIYQLILRGTLGTSDTADISIWHPQLEWVTGQANQNPSEYASSASTYNAGVAGVRYFDYQNGNTVVSNVVTEATGAAISPAPAILHEGSATNYFLQSGTPATQNITLAAGTYTCWLDDTNGLGSITLVGGATGVATAAAPLTFVASGAAITFTVAGAANVRAQVEGGSYRTSYIPTTTAAVTRAIDSSKLPEVLSINFFQAQGISLIKLKMKFANSASNKAILAYNTGATDFIYDNGSGGIALGDGTNTATAAVGGWAADDTLLIAACRNSRNGLMSVHVSKNGGAWVDSSDATYDGAVATGSNILLASANTDSIEFNHVKLYKTTKSFAAMQRWIKTKAAQEAA